MTTTGWTYLDSFYQRTRYYHIRIGSRRYRPYTGYRAGRGSDRNRTRLTLKKNKDKTFHSWFATVMAGVRITIIPIPHYISERHKNKTYHIMIRVLSLGDVFRNRKNNRGI